MSKSKIKTIKKSSAKAPKAKDAGFKAMAGDKQFKSANTFKKSK